MLRGNAPATIDEKGRLKLPVDVQTFLGSFGDDKLFVTSVDDRIARIYPISVWKGNEKILEQLSTEDPDAADFVVGEIANASVEVDVAGFTDLLRSRAADAEDVGEGDLDSLFARDVDAGDTCHGGWTPQP